MGRRWGLDPSGYIPGVGTYLWGRHPPIPGRKLAHLVGAGVVSWIKLGVKQASFACFSFWESCLMMVR